jgi:hypothetical protein
MNLKKFDTDPTIFATNFHLQTNVNFKKQHEREREITSGKSLENGDLWSWNALLAQLYCSVSKKRKKRVKKTVFRRSFLILYILYYICFY